MSRHGHRLWQAPEVVQTSAMDCGPAALTCLLRGHGIQASYGRLREACQTDLDGTAIDTLEAVAAPLGLQAEQVMLPRDHVLLPEADTLPAIAVTRLPDGGTHFVVLWRRIGPWVQVMDPASGRRWLPAHTLTDSLFLHRLSVPAPDWRQWAASADCLRPLTRRLRQLGVAAGPAQGLIDRALADDGWFSLGALDAGVRMVQSVVDSGGLAQGDGAARLVQALADEARARSDDIFSVVPERFWSATPDADSVALGALHLHLQGAVLLRVRGRLAAPVPAATANAATANTGVHAANTANTTAAPQPNAFRSPELTAALREPPTRPLARAWALLRQGGLLAPMALAAAMAVAATALVLEALLLRGVFDIADQLGLPMQRLTALAALVGFAALLLALELPIMAESLRLGRHLEARLRLALLAKLPRLGDRYFHSRSVGDMAERVHSLPLTRQGPSLGGNLLQTGAELLLTLAGLAWIAPASLSWALAIAGLSIALPWAMQRWLAERDLRVRQHASAMNAVVLDALLGGVPIRSHQAQAAVRRLHEAALVRWAQACRGLARAGLAADGLHGLLCAGLTGAMLLRHFQAHGQVTGADLLLVYWALKLPALGSGLAGLARQWPGQRNTLARVLEPLDAAEEAADNAAGTGPMGPAGQAGPVGQRTAHPAVPTRGAPASTTPAGVDIHLEGGRVVAGGHTLLQDLALHIPAGQHVAIVGASGAGKSTLLGLLLGWHRLAEGRLLLDGQAQGADRSPAWRRTTAWVDPQVQLWDQPMLDNLNHASPDTGLDRVATVVAAAGLQPVLGQLPQGLQTPLGEGGVRLSGGQGQRVRLARAFMQPGVRLALLDEPFRGLDRGQRRTLLQRARRWWSGCTLLCVTHDVHETRGFDRVLVVEDGRIVEDGPPARLAAEPGRYAALLQADEADVPRLWQHPGWRAWQVEGGRLHEGPAPHPSHAGQPDPA